MSRSVSPGAAVDFSARRRGGLTGEEIREIEAHRAKARPTPWQALADRFGRPVSDIQAAVALPEVKPVLATKPDTFALPETWDSTRFWNAENIARLKMLFIEADLSASKTADILGCTREAVIGKASRMGFKKRAMRAEAAK